MIDKISYSVEDLKKAFNAGKETKVIRTQGNWNKDVFSDYEEKTVLRFKSFEEYIESLK